VGRVGVVVSLKVEVDSDGRELLAVGLVVEDGVEMVEVLLGVMVGVMVGVVVGEVVGVVGVVGVVCGFTPRGV